MILEEMIQYFDKKASRDSSYLYDEFNTQMWYESSEGYRQVEEWLKELKSLKSMKDSIIKIINCKAPAAGKYDMIVDEVMEHETFGCGEG